MPITPQQIQAAQAIQNAASHDESKQVRMVAGPGTGKSFVIEERVRWLLDNGVFPEKICGVSFTRAAALDLRRRVHTHCLKNGQPNAKQVRISTLHSLALRTLRAAGLLNAYPADPLVLDSWEVDSIFDAEFGKAHGIGKTRRQEIRREHEAFWSTGQWSPPNYIPPHSPITDIERSHFQAFHAPRTQIYSCVLPGEIVRKCVEHMKSGTLDPVSILGLTHLIVDEYQDLNPIDLEFVDRIAAQDVRLFVAGDDDQSVYSFRYALPSGLQDFHTKYPIAGLHTLSNCFRCATSVLATAQALIKANPGPKRIPKQHVSMYSHAVPSVNGTVHHWQFASGIAEARSIAKSCKDLIQVGINPREILILICNLGALGRTLSDELQAAQVPFELARAENFLDSEAGRLVLSIARIAADRDDYVAHRIILGLLPGVGEGTTNGIAEKVVSR